MLPWFLHFDISWTKWKKETPTVLKLRICIGISLVKPIVLRSTSPDKKFRLVPSTPETKSKPKLPRTRKKWHTRQLSLFSSSRHSNKYSFFLKKKFSLLRTSQRFPCFRVWTDSVHWMQNAYFVQPVSLELQRSWCFLPWDKSYLSPSDQSAIPRLSILETRKRSGNSFPVVWAIDQLIQFCALQRSKLETHSAHESSVFILCQKTDRSV